MPVLRFSTAGESHGPEMTAILDGLPAGLRFDRERVDQELARRQQGFGSGGRMKIERDRVSVRSGVLAGCTTGAPLTMVVTNRDFAHWNGREVEALTIPRPGHADLTAAIKYGHRELRLSLERASARETVARVAVGAVVKGLLQEFGIRVVGFVTRIGSVVAALAPDADPLVLSDLAEADEHEVRCPDPLAARAMRAAILEARKNRDTLGGCLQVVAVGVPPGLGSFAEWDRRLDGRLMGAVGSIPAIKGVELGPAFDLAGERGTEVHDAILLDGDGKLRRPTNRCGGLEGGITNGEPVVVRAAMKPIATTLQPMPSVDLATGRPADHVYERSDICAVPRATVVAESMVAFVLADALLEKLGGDELGELRTRFAGLRRARLADLPMNGRPWRFGDGLPEAAEP